MAQFCIIFHNWQKGATALCAWLRKNQHRSICLSKKVILYQTGFIIVALWITVQIFSTANPKTWGVLRGCLRVWAFGFWLQQCLCAFQSITALSLVNEFTKPPQEDPKRPASSLWRGSLKNWKGKKRKKELKRKRGCGFQLPIHVESWVVQQTKGNKSWNTGRCELFKAVFLDTD